MHRNFVIDIEPEAIKDIQEAIEFYNSRKENLGELFFRMVDNHFE